MILYKTLRVVLIISLIGGLLSSCDNQDKPAPTITKDESGIPVYEINQDYPYEDLDDAEFYKYPRLQFVWNKRNGESPVLMSIRTDGTDLRQVIDPESVFYGGARHFTHKPVRSPNRRYLAYSNTATGISLPDRVLYDLKTSERITIIKSQTGKAQYFWSPDSDNLFFHGDEMYRYHVPSKTLYKLPEFIYGLGIFALDDNKTIIAVTENSIAYHDYMGKKLKEYNLPFGNHKSPFRIISKDGKYFAYLRSDNSLYYSLFENASPILLKKPKLPRISINVAIFNENNRGLYIRINRGFGFYDLDSEYIQKIVLFGGSVGQLTRLF